ncbi:hypothetical protein [Kitasatospora indigofera]|uniref:hypothetical protein n=1 Tax=Kitasatospora indigofera TaxID=67307 RepID=UPI00367EF530
MTPAERGDLAERLLPYAARLACLVRGDGNERDIAQHIARLDRGERDALLVVLAALVDPDMPLAEALGHVTWDEHGRPAERPRLSGSVRSLTLGGKEWPLVGWGATDMLRFERVTAARIWLAAGETHEDIGERLGVSGRTVARYLDELAEAAA